MKHLWILVVGFGMALAARAEEKSAKQIYLSVRELSFRGELSELVDSEKGWKTGDPEFDAILRSLFDFPDPAMDLTEGSSGRAFDTLEAFANALAAPPKSSPGDSRKGRLIRQTGALTDRQMQVALRRLNQSKGVELLNLPSVMVRSGQAGITQTEARRFGIVATLDDDKGAIALDLFLPETGKAFENAGAANLQPTLRTRIPDRYYVVVAEKNPDGANRLIFIQAQSMDPAGTPN